MSTPTNQRCGAFLRQLLCTTGFACLCLFGSLASAAPKADLWPFWQASNQASVETISHAPWQQILDHYLDAEHASGIARFNYAAVSATDKNRLLAYLENMQALDPRDYRKAEQLAYWINLYNALTVQRVLLAYPVDSILRVGGGLFRRGPWNEKLLNIAGQAISLNDIEHRILRPIWRDYRIHFAVNCASLGCPNLSATAYTAELAEVLLEQAAEQYLAHPRGVEFSNGQLTLSKLFDWYQEDFGENERAVLQTLSQHVSADQAERLRQYRGDIQYQYDWAINKP